MTEPPAGATPPSGLARDSSVVGAATLLSRLLGFARDVLIARLLGAGPAADAFLAALRLPNLVRRVLGEGGLNAPFVPLYLAVRAQSGDASARRFSGEALAHLGVLLLALVAVGEVFAPWVVLGLAGGFAEEPQTLALASLYTRLMLPFLLLTTLAAMLAAILNAERRFAVAALAPALMNLLLVGFLVLALIRGAAPDTAALWLAAMVSLTGAAHLLLVLSALARLGLPRPSLRWSPDMTSLVRTGGATLLAASSAQLVLLVATQIASSEPGAVAALYYADRVFQLPLGFVGVAMGTVALSHMAAPDARERDAALGQALTLGLALAIPAATALILLADPIVSVLFEHGRFGAQDRERTAAALAAFAVGLPFAVIAKVFGQVYFARQTPRVPLLAGLAAIGLALAVGLLAAGDAQAARRAAMAASAAFVAQAAILGVALARDGLWRPSLRASWPICAALAGSLAMLGAILLLREVLPDPLSRDASIASRVLGLSGLCLGGLAAYAVTGWRLGAFGPHPLRAGRA